MPRPRKHKPGAKRITISITDQIDFGIEKMARLLTVKSGRNISRNDVYRQCLEVCVIGNFKGCEESFLTSLSKEGNRDLEIRNRSAAGESNVSLAKDFNLSRERVRQILSST